MKIKNSPKLNHAIEEACSISLHRQEGDEEAAYRKFYDALCDTSPHGDMIREQNFTVEEMIDIIQNLRKGRIRFDHVFLYAYICLVSHENLQNTFWNTKMSCVNSKDRMPFARRPWA